MAVFHELKTHGEKIIKFKQGKVLDNDVAFWENVTTSLAGGEFNFGKGVCAALTMRFIAELLSNTNLIDFDGDSTNFSFKRDKGVSSKNELNQGLYNEAIKFQNAYSLIFKTSGNAPAVKQMAAAFGLAPVSVDRDMIDFSFADFMVSESKKAKTGQAAYIAFNFKKKNNDTGSHAVAIGTRLGVVYFFDSNVGGYKISLSSLGAFFGSYVKCYSVAWAIEDVGMDSFWFKKT